jgi:hypothetical protein
MTGAIDTWPVSVRAGGERTLLGIFDPLGNGADLPGGPTLDEIGAEDWSGQVLAQLLPAQRTWAWCTQTSVYRKSGIEGRRAPKSIELSQVREPLAESLMLKRMTLAVVPPAAPTARSAVLKWAALDTEQIADHLWTAPDSIAPWDIEEIMAWCLDSQRWGNPGTLASHPAERIITMFDGQTRH